MLMLSRAAGALALYCLLAGVPIHAQDSNARPEPRFDIWEFEVSGNSMLDARAIEKTVYPFLGPSRAVADVEQARQALEALYRDSGFGAVAVNIPEQDVDQGIVRLEVLEGTVDRLIISGSTWFSPDRIRQATPSLAEGTVPDLPQVQREIQALNAASADRRITPVLRPGRYPGTLEVELKVDDDPPIHGSLEYNNRYTRDTSRTRATATLTYANLWQREHSATLGYQTAPQETDDVSVFFATYTARIPDSQWIASGYFVDSDSSVSTIGTLGVLGKGQIGGLRLIRPLPMLGGGFQRLTLGIDLKDFDESIALTGNQPAIETPISYGTLTGGWNLSFIQPGRVTEFGLRGIFGPRFLGNDAAEFANKRSRYRPECPPREPGQPDFCQGAKASFAYLGFNLSQEWALDSERALKDGPRLRMALAGQLADTALISNEQFSFGGATTVRGYLESQQFADDGYAAQLELLSPDWGTRVPGLSSMRLLTFVDAGGGRIQDPQPEQDDNFFLWSAGLGLRAALWKSLNASLDWAYPLRDSSDDSIQSGDDHWHFNITWEF